MIRNLLASTAVLAILTTPALAQDTGITSKDFQNDRVIYEFDVSTVKPDTATGFLASNMIGKSVLNTSTGEATEIGTVNDLVLSRDGAIRAAIVGVGGFLGLGEKDVAIDYDRLSFTARSDGEFDVASDVTRAELENANGFERPDYIPDWMTVSAVQTEIDKISESAKQTYETVRTEAIDPAKKRLNETIASWTAEKTRVQSATVSSEALIGSSVHSSADANIGEISQVLLNEDGKAEAVVIDVGGFLGFNEKPVAVSYDSLQMYETENGALLVVAPFTKSELENAKAFEPAAYKKNPDAVTLNG
ncbi:PRC-barrel domain-containing protein [Roseibium sp.]|uniref:PRC-barrel domain-containing protein n=1 Tax=Roseibium sp. TaxID=1936156 RepID=UPI003919EFCA